MWWLQSIQNISNLNQLARIQCKYILLLVIFEWKFVFVTPRTIQCGLQSEGYYCFCSSKLTFRCQHDNKLSPQSTTFIKVSVTEWSPLFDGEMFKVLLEHQTTEPTMEYCVVRYHEFNNIATVLSRSPLLDEHKLVSDKIEEYCKYCGNVLIASIHPTATRQTDEMYKVSYMCNRCN